MNLLLVVNPLPVPAAEMALTKADMKVTDMKAIKTHNPFSTNDLNFAIKMGVDVMKMCNYGSSLIYGHPQAPTAGRAIAELIEETALVVAVTVCLPVALPVIPPRL